MSTRRTDDGTYPNVDEERAKNDARALYGTVDRETGVQIISDEAFAETGPYAAVREAERAAREPLETEDEGSRSSDARRPRVLEELARAAGDGDAATSDGEDLELVRRAEVRLDAVDFLDGLDDTVCVAIAIEDFFDGSSGSSELVVVAIDEDGGETELVRLDARKTLDAIDRLRAFGADPNPPRERTASDVNAALERVIGEIAPVVARALGVPPLRPVPGGGRK